MSFLRRRPRQISANKDGRVDLYLGFGAWSLIGDLPTNGLRRVIAATAGESGRAKQSGVEILIGDADMLSFTPASVALSVHYPYRIGKDLRSRYQNCYNLHPGYLPWCRGLSSVNWAMWEGSPTGATLHEMTEALDAGPIVDQIEVPYQTSELCGEVQKRVHNAESELLQRYWTKIVSGERLASSPQPSGGSMHTQKQLSTMLRKLHDQDYWSQLNAAELVRMARCFGQLELAYDERRMRVLLAPSANRHSEAQ